MLHTFYENIAFDRRPSFGVWSAFKLSKTRLLKPEAQWIANVCFSDSNGRSD